MCSIGCYRTAHQQSADVVPLSESFFESTLNSGWTADIPPVRGAEVRLDNGELRLTMPSGAEGRASARIRMDAVQMRGKRLQLAVKVRTDAPPNSLAHAAITTTPGSRVPSYGDLANSRAINSASQIVLRTAMDVASDATSVEVTLVLDGAGSAWFDDLRLSADGPARSPHPVALTPEQVSSIITLARAVALVRYLHPSDQVANADWDDFIARAVERVLQVKDRRTLVETLRLAFSELAPTVTFLGSTDSGLPHSPERGHGTHLARWRRYGSGSTGTFTTFREGRDTDAAAAEWVTKVHVSASQRCRTAKLSARAHTLGGTGAVTLFIRRLDPGISSKEFTAPIANETSLVVASAELTSDASDLELGVRAVGRCSAVLEGISLSCDTGPAPSVDFVHSEWTPRNLAELYQWHADACPAGTCATVQRAPLDTAFEPARDLDSVDIGEGVRVVVPLALWADDTKTFPGGTPSVPSDSYTISDLPLRLAAVVSAWASISMLYPYFDDLHIDWISVLPSALAEAAAAGSPADLHAALQHMLTHLHDDHVKVLHPAAQVDGVLPIAFRRIDRKIVVIGGMSEYMTGVTAGDELVSLDGVVAMELYERVTRKVSAATDGWSEYVTPYRMGAGPIGSFHRVTIKDAAGTERSLSLPLVSDTIYDHVARDPRPKSGAELAPGLLYVDFDGLSVDDWAALLPALQNAKGIIFDFRGYSGRTAFTALSNITDMELRSPILQIPVVGTGSHRRYVESSWYIRPAAPRLRAHIVALADGRSVSAMETVLQIFKVGRLGTLVGETSAGTNGSVGWLTLPGGFSVRFSALRVAYADGTSMQGHGLVPDQIIHPTLGGIRAGRDEVLDAGIEQLRRLLSR